MSDAYPIFERDAHGFPVRVRWIENTFVPDAFLTYDGILIDPDASDRDAHTASGAADSDPSAHGAT